MFKLITFLMAWRRLKAADAARPRSMPGEHLLTAGAGLWLMSSARTRTSFLSRWFVRGAGLALLVRAASGRDGLARFKR